MSNSGALSTESGHLPHGGTKDKVLALTRPFLVPGARVLDLGAGEGHFSRQLGEHVRGSLGVEPSAVLSACDTVPQRFRYAEVHCDAVGEHGRLPYPDETFDVVISLEVIEHVEDQFAFLREACRVLGRNGTLIVSTPNVLNMNSRWRFLHSGFAQPVDPLPLDARVSVHTPGHTHPVSYYYLAYAMRAAGCRHVDAHFDHFKRSATAQLILFGPAILLGRLGFRLRMARKRRPETAQNADDVKAMNSLAMLTSRSVIAVGKK